MRRRRYAIAGAVVVALAALGAAWATVGAGDDTGRAGPTAPAATGTPPGVIVPGRPGESAAVVPGDQVPIPDGSSYNVHDVRFVQMMIPHHRQAVELAALAPTRARDPRVRAIAERISVAQGPEIEVFRAWLTARQQPAEPAGHDHGDMPGMATPDQVAALAAARGADFDRLFVELMSAHHEGAVEMCRQVLRDGADERLRELATGIAAEQRIEIARMREVVAG